MNNGYKEVGYIGLRNSEGEYYISAPVYVKISELNPNILSEETEKIIHKISEVVQKNYEKQLNEYFTQKRKKIEIELENKKLLEEMKW